MSEIEKFEVFGSFGIQGLTAALQRCQPFIGQDQSICCDLSNCTWVEPAGLVVLAGIIDHARRYSTPQVVYPNNDLGNYLKRMDLFAVVGADVEEAFNRHFSANRFQELSRVPRDRVEELSRALVECFHLPEPDMGQILELLRSR